MKDLEIKAETALSHCNNNGVKVHRFYKGIASGMYFDRKKFRERSGQASDYHPISAISITNKDRFFSIPFDTFERKKTSWTTAAKVGDV